MLFALIVAVAFHTLNFLIHFRERHLPKEKSNSQYFITTFFHMTSAVLAYFMVYCVKTMNIWLLISVILGSGIGQLVIGPFVAVKLEQKHQYRHGGEHEPLSDFSTDETTLKSGYSTNPQTTSFENDLDQQTGHDIELTFIGTNLINLDDLFLQTSVKANNTNHKPADYDDDDQISEYDGFNEDLSTDLKLLTEETRV